MSVNGVNNSNNTALYTTSGAVLGAGAGVAAGYLTKPFLKDGAPTDEFIKKLDENLINATSPEKREGIKAFRGRLKQLNNTIEKAKNLDELKRNLIDYVFGNPENISIEKYKNNFRDNLPRVRDDFESIGIKVTEDFIGRVENAKSFDEIKNILKEDMDKTFAGKSIDEVKNMSKSQLNKIKELERKGLKEIFTIFWDSSEKKFINSVEALDDLDFAEGTEGAKNLLKALKKSAQSIQGKYAAIYGAVGAAVLGLTTYLCCGGKKNEQPVQPQHVNKQV